MKKHILVVDDNELICEVIKDIFEFEGHQTATSATGRNFSALVAAERPDLIFLDIMLDGFDGRELCREIKSDPDLWHIPVVLISAGHDLNENTVRYCMADDFIRKPFDIHQLARAARKHMQYADEANTSVPVQETE